MNLDLCLNAQEVQVDTPLGPVHSCIPNHPCVIPGKGGAVLLTLSSTHSDTASL